MTRIRPRGGDGTASAPAIADSTAFAGSALAVVGRHVQLADREIDEGIALQLGRVFDALVRAQRDPPRLEAEIAQLALERRHRDRVQLGEPAPVFGGFGAIALVEARSAVTG